MALSAELVEAVRHKKALLFVGAGVSMNLGLPSFRGLIDHVAQMLGYDPELFSTHGDYFALAEYYQLERGSIGPLRSWMDKEWHHNKDIRQSKIHKLIVDLDLPIIYTTNFDSWLERAYEAYGRKYSKISNVGDFVDLQPGVTQIIKFHGDFEDDASIVLTESSYFERLDFESPLDVKLRADLLGRTVLFIGYNLADINIRLLLYKLNQQWRASPFFRERPKSFIFLTRPNAVQEKILASRGIDSIVTDTDDPGEGLERFLHDLSHAAAV
jgi:hypothetical protein